MEQSFFLPLIDIAEFLEDSKTVDTLSRMQSVYRQKQYFIAFAGQYSAGKSALLNSLLKRRLLPEGTIETTALLTYIRYGEREEARLHYTDGAVQIIGLDQVAQLAQHTDGVLWDAERLEFLEIFLNENMLRSGMILLDTPGVNTLIERHERLLDSSLSIAASIVYVTGSAPSLVDTKMLSMLSDSGFNTIFVRTHCDEIKLDEETLEQVKTADRISLEECGIAGNRCYYISNKESSPLFAALDPLREELAAMGGRAEAQLDADTERQLRVFAQRLHTSLEARRDLLELAAANNAQELEKQRSELLVKISRLESRIGKSELSAGERIEACKHTLRGDTVRQLNCVIENSGRRIENAAQITDEMSMSELLQHEASDFCRKAYQLINASIDPLVQQINGELSADSVSLNIQSLPQSDNYQELRAEQDEFLDDLRERLATLQSHKKELAQELEAIAGSPEYMQIQQELAEFQNAAEEAQKSLAGLPPYEPQMIEVNDTIQPSVIARRIGAAADWAMLLVPGAQIEAGLAKLGKIPAVAKTLGKFVGVIEKVGKAAKKGDTIKDILFALKQISEHTRTSPRREDIAKEKLGKVAKGAGALIDARKMSDHPSVLDYLTLEHWAGKLGEMFDHAPRLVIDEEYETQYKEAKAQIESTLREAQRIAYRKKLEMGLIKEKEEKLRSEQENICVDQEEVAKELAAREARLRSEAMEKALKKWRRACSAWYMDEMKKHLHDVIDSYIGSFPERLEEYRRSQSQTIRDQLAKEQTALDELCSAPRDETAVQLQRVNELLTSLGNVYNE